MSAANHYLPHYTVDDYRGWEGDWELWNGIPISMSPSPFGKHQMVLVNLVAELRTALRTVHCDATVLCEIDWILSPNTILRPDALVVCGEPPERHVETTPAVVAEVLSPSTAERDRTYKKRLYEQAGVGIYLILDPTNQSIQAFRQTNNGFQDEDTSGGLSMTVCGQCEIHIKPRSLFSR
ncbi:MAG: Uma2 family endonuclease [Planctomycetales bacterium]|nr:Uma2 family endonuclease [Planctomycetales bacterium]